MKHAVDRAMSVPALALALSLASLSPLSASPQAVQPPTQPGPVGAGSLGFPRLMIGAGVGHAGLYERSLPLQTVSGQYLVGRHFVVAADVSHWDDTWEDGWPGFQLRTSQGQVVGFTGLERVHNERRAWLVSGSLLYRSEPRRISWYAGGGPAFWRHRTVYARLYEGTQCTPGFESYCSFFQSGYASDTTGAGPIVQGLAGVDVQVAGPVRAYADLRFGTMNQANLQVSTGVRVVALTQRLDADAARRARRIRETRPAPLAPAVTSGQAPATAPSSGVPPTMATARVGTDVRVSLTDGMRPRGKLVSLTDTDVTLRQGNRDVRYPLAQTLIVETVSHGVRKGALIGLAAGGLLGTLARCDTHGDDCPTSGAWIPVAMLVGGGIGSAVGAGIGAMANAANASHRLLYVAPAAPASVSLAPYVGPRRAGVNVAILW